MTVLDNPQSISRLLTEEVDQYLLLLRDLVWRVLEGAEDPAGLKKRLGQLLKQGYPAEFQLPHAYLVLLQYLLKLEPSLIEPRQMPSGAACLDALGLCKGAELPEPSQHAELGSLWMILGIHLKNEALLYAGLKIALWQTHLLDHRGLPHFSLWGRAFSFHPAIVAASNHLLFTLAHRITGDPGFYQAAQIQKHHGWNPSSLAAKLLTLIPEKISSPVRLSRLFAEEMTVGILKYATSEWSMACSISGWNSGIFSYHKNNIAIVNCAPQTAPFDALEGFGIDRTCSLTTRGFSETVWEKTVHHFRLKGWTKIFAHPAWMQIEAFYQAQKLTLSCLLQEGCPRDNLAMVFYARGDQLGIGGKTALHAGTLERYQGKSMPLELRSGNEMIFIEPQSDQEMQIIPLAGGDHFWGAHFLIAFSFSNGKDLFQCTIK
ncbi:MAG: hypothetical protein JSS10_00555 [Verrucomicrobia bacterium]|nr:hypothetical protein [Verrucomicrobiota bacterium]